MAEGVTAATPTGGVAGRAVGLGLSPELVLLLREQLPGVAERTVAALTAEVGEYARSLDSEMRTTIESAVQVALGAFLRLAAPAHVAGSDPGTPMSSALEGAYDLGRGEARSGRTTAALLSAYRVGARVSWREWAATAVAWGLPAMTVAQFAELVFAYIDELSAASVAGHADELATSGRAREQYRERLGQAVLSGAPADALLAAATRADWEPPACLTAVLVPSALARGTVDALPRDTLRVSGDLAGPSGAPDDTTVLLVPGPAGADGRAAVLRALRGRAAVVGPGRPWEQAASSYRRAVRAWQQHPPAREPVDTEAHLPELVLTADGEALADLRAAALAPLADLRPATAARLAETLRSWLLHQGRREEVAADLVVHPQTVRYRMGQLRELYGDALTDPEQVLRLTLALAVLPDSGAAGG